MEITKAGRTQSQALFNNWDLKEDAKMKSQSWLHEFDMWSSVSNNYWSREFSLLIKNSVIEGTLYSPTDDQDRTAGCSYILPTMPSENCHRIVSTSKRSVLNCICINIRSAVKPWESPETEKIYIIDHSLSRISNQRGICKNGRLRYSIPNFSLPLVNWIEDCVFYFLLRLHGGHKASKLRKKEFYLLYQGSSEWAFSTFVGKSGMRR